MSIDTDRQAWLARRKTGIGGSDIAGVLGVSPWTTPYQVWLDKTTSDTDEQPTMAMELGHVLEPFILGKYEQQTGHHVGARQMELTHSSSPHRKATLDGIAFDPADEHTPIALVEAKATHDYTWDDVPLYYYVQAQWQLHVAEGIVDRCIVAVLHDRREIELYEIEPDPDDIAQMVDAADRFWADHVLAGIPPEPTADDLDAVRYRHRDYTPATSRTATLDLEVLVDQYRAARDYRIAAEAEEDRYAARLIAEIGDAEQLVDPTGRVLATYKRPRAFALDRAAADHPELAEQARTINAAAFKKALGKKIADTYLEPSTSDTGRRLYLPTNKKDT